MESKHLWTFPSNEQVTFHECSVRLMDPLIKNNEQTCAVQADRISLNLLESDKENIDLSEVLPGVKNRKFNAKCLTKIFSREMIDTKEECVEPKTKFTCSYCQAVFSQQEHMNYHIKIVHKIYDSVLHCMSLNSNNENTSISLKKIDDISLSKSEVHIDDIDGKYICSKCSYVSTSNKLYVEHLQDIHNISKIHSCPECNETFPYLKDFRDHMKSKHSHILCLTCPKCPLTFHSRTIMKNHFFKNHATSKELFCNLCFESFSQLFNLKKHFMTVHQLHGSKLEKALSANQASNKKYFELIENDSTSINVIKNVKSINDSIDCNLVNVSAGPASVNYGNVSEFEIHGQLSTNIKLESAKSVIYEQHKASSIGKETITTEGIISYADISFDKFANKYYCSLCLATFSSKEESSIHLKDVHAEKNDYMCFDCSKLFPQTSLLRDHIDNLHKSLNIFTCDSCQDTFFSKTNVMAHIKKCILNLKFTKQSFCEICSTAFVSKENLVQHIKSVHQKIKPFSCTDCGKSFYSRQKVQRHARAVHEKLKPYGCHECDKYFSTTGNRKQHIDAVHKNIRLHTCEICLISFTNRASMKQHIISVHMKLKPFKCSYCEATFSLKVICQQHEYSVHLKLKLYKCQKCGSSYGWQRSLSKHRCFLDKIKPNRHQTN